MCPGMYVVIGLLSVRRVSFVVRSVLDTTFLLLALRQMSTGHRMAGVTSVSGFRWTR
jgi:hypothetical protein